VISAFERVVEASLEDLPADTNNFGPELADKAAQISSFSLNFRCFVGMYTLLLMIRLFISFDAQPRLATVTKTLETAAFDIVHFIVVMIPVWLAYAMAGCFIFGRRMEEFSTPDASIGYCFKLVIEGEFDWPYYSQENYETALVWVWSFMILLNVIMLNMVLAIVLDVYSQIRSASGKSETVWMTAYNIAVVFYNRKAWVSAAKIHEALNGMPAEVTREEILAAFPTMCDAQLNALMEECYTQVEIDHHSIAAGTEPYKMAMSCKLLLDQVSENVKLLHTGTMETTGLEQTPGSKWVEGLADEMSMQNQMMLSLQWKLQQIEWQWKAIESVHGSEPQFQDVQPVDDAGEAKPVL